MLAFSAAALPVYADETDGQDTSVTQGTDDSSSDNQLTDTDSADTSVGSKATALISISDAVVGSISDKVYTGNVIKPKPTVKLGGVKLTCGTDYTLSYKNNKSCGKATITIKGFGNYTDTIKTTFNIIPKTPTLKSVKATGVGEITAAYSKAAGSNGYQIRYTTGGSCKYVKVSGKSTLSKALSNLTHGKTYTVSVRAYYLTSGGKYYYSKWSSSKKATLTKYSGYTLINGYLYYFKSGKPVKDKTVGNLYFGTDGKYTSGNKSLDKTVAKIIRENTTESMTKIEKLRALDKYLVNNYSYSARPYVDVGASGWENKYAVNMFKDKCGNCYSWAAAFTCLAKGVGYNAVAVSGWCTSYLEWGWSRHGFTEIMVNGVAYIRDPELEHAYGKDLFFKTAENQQIYYTHTA